MSTLDASSVDWRVCPGAHVCAALAWAKDEPSAVMIVAQARTIDRLTGGFESSPDASPVARLERAVAQRNFDILTLRGRVQELEETVVRLNRTNPRKLAVAICEELAERDPRRDDLLCFYCYGENEQHERDCIWKQAVGVAAVAAKDRAKQQ